MNKKMWKECRKCFQVKRIEDFSTVPPKQTRDGFSPWCKSCHSASARKYNRMNPEQHKKTYAKWYAKYGHDYYQKNKIKYRKRAIVSALRIYFNMSLEDYEALYKSQNGTCAICKEPCLTGRRLGVDHNHKTGKVRGLLCMKCNRGLGYLGDDSERLKLALAYLEKYQEIPT